jgi:hypothetical protein
MFNVATPTVPRFPLFLGALLLAIPALGCGDASGVGRTVPVSGKVILQDEPLTAKTTIVLFKPDASKGNTSPFEPTGTVDAEGILHVDHQGQEGRSAGLVQGDRDGA